MHKPVMVVVGGNRRYVIPTQGWTTRELQAIALTYESDGYAVTTGYGR